jgi:O-antigen ligase
LRALGETGLLGFLSFFGIIAVAMAKSLNQARKELTTPLYKAVSVGFFAASVALLINAIYIDVFEASKVAMSYWAFAGIVLALPKLEIRKS